MINRDALDAIAKNFTGLGLEELTPERLLELMQKAGAHYVCVRDPHTGQPMTPLVGYAGRDPEGRQLVGYEYLNFGHAEENPILIWAFAVRMFELYQRHLTGLATPRYQDTVADVVCGMPMGGLHPAYTLTMLCRQFMANQARYIHPEKVTLEATDGGKRRSRLEFGGRHDAPARDAQVALVEDVCNNMQTTWDGIRQIEAGGARVTVILCCVNAGSHEGYFQLPDGRKIPIIAAVRHQFPSLPQTDPYAAIEVARNNVRFDTRRHWDELVQAMHVARAQQMPTR